MREVLAEYVRIYQTLPLLVQVCVNLPLLIGIPYVLSGMLMRSIKRRVRRDREMREKFKQQFLQEEQSKIS